MLDFSDMDQQLKIIKKNALAKFRIRMKRDVAHSTPKPKHLKKLSTVSKRSLDGWIVVTPGGTKRHGVVCYLLENI